MLAEPSSSIPLLSVLLSLLLPDSHPFIARLKSTHLKHGSVCVRACVCHGTAACDKRTNKGALFMTSKLPQKATVSGAPLPLLRARLINASAPCKSRCQRHISIPDQTPPPPPHPPSTNNAVLKMISRVLSVPIAMTLNEKSRGKEGKIIAGDKEALV